MSHSFDTKRWLRLAMSEQAADQQAALIMAKEGAAVLQTELLYWFACNTAFRYRFAIYELLNEANKERALALIADKGDLPPFDRTLTFEEFKKTEEVEMQQAISYLERWFMRPSDAFKNTLYLEYKNRKLCDIDSAKLAVNRLFTEAPGQAADDMEGEMRHDE